MREILCDREGVPLLIQRLKFIYSVMVFEVLFFNDEIIEFSADRMCPSIGLLQHRPKRMQWLEAENNITKFALLHWKELFPSAYKEKEI